MPKTIKLTLTEDEAAIVADALETDADGYDDALKDARANGPRADVATFTEAAQRVRAVLARVRAELGE